MLSTFQDLFGNDPAGEPLAQQVAQSLIGHSSYWYTTQELVWSITGLGKRVSGAASSFTPPTLVADGKEVAPKNNEGGKTVRASDRTWALVRASERKGVTLDLKDKGEGKLYLIINSDGVRSSGDVKTGGNGLAISRTYKKLDGSTVSPGDAVNLADLLYVEVELKNTSGERIQNIALVDRLPAGWEIENARLGRGGAVEWLDPEQLWTADYVNIRDDRMEVFGSLQAGESKKVVYAVRAVTAGKFTLPPVEAEAMYDPRIWAREAGEQVRGLRSLEGLPAVAPHEAAAHHPETAGRRAAAPPRPCRGRGGGGVVGAAAGAALVAALGRHRVPGRHSGPRLPGAG